MNKFVKFHKDQLMELIITSSPKDHGMRSDHWTARSIQRLISLKWGIEIKKSYLYSMIGELKEESSLFRAKLKIPLNLDLSSWKKFYDYNPLEKDRKKLWALKYCYQGKNKIEILNLLNCSASSLDKWVRCFNSGGLEKLLSKTNWVNLKPKDKKELLKILLHKKPIDYGIGKNHWEPVTVTDIASLKLGIKLAISQACEILEEVRK